LIEADPAETEKAKKTEKKKGFYLPAGSMMTGVLITGLDAPTGTKTRSEPYPVLVRIKHETILPNRYRANFRECFVLAGGYGDLSSERAYLRAERLSCIRTDNGVVDIPLDAYAAGEDGKVGLRGTLVSKQGQVLNKALIAGVAQGFSQAFQSYRVPTINTNGSNDAQYQQIISPEALTSAGLNGVGTALEKLADFYFDQAQQMFTIIEVHARRKVNFIMTQ
jgi:conjugal transfer pilus assembly protein TraB